MVRWAAVRRERGLAEGRGGGRDKGVIWGEG